MHNLSKSGIAMLAFVYAGFAIADDSGTSEDEPKRERRGPPPVALEACAAAIEGDSCGFENRRGVNIEGTCTVTRKEELACRPAGGHPRKHFKRRDSDAEGESSE